MIRTLPVYFLISEILERFCLGYLVRRIDYDEWKGIMTRYLDVKGLGLAWQEGSLANVNAANGSNLLRQAARRRQHGLGATHFRSRGLWMEAQGFLLWLPVPRTRIDHAQEATKKQSAEFCRMSLS